MSSPAYLNVTFTFPDGNAFLTLHSNSDLLSAASPYFKSLFASDFSEKISQVPLTPIETLPITRTRERAFQDSDDEAEQSAPSTPPTAAYRVEVSETSFKTYQAVLHWLHTGQIHFAPLTSSRYPTTPSAGRAFTPAALTASPKSVYRLADFLVLPCLVSLTLDSIVRQVKVSNAIEELTSDVSALYEPLQAALLKYVAKNWREVKSSEGWKSLREKVLAKDDDVSESTLWICLQLLDLLSE